MILSEQTGKVTISQYSKHLQNNPPDVFIILFKLVIVSTSETKFENIYGGHLFIFEW